MQWTADNLVPMGHVWKEIVRGASIPFKREASMPSQCTRIELTLSMLTRFSLSYLPAVDYLVKSRNFAQTVIIIEIDSTFCIQNYTT